MVPVRTSLAVCISVLAAALWLPAQSPQAQMLFRQGTQALRSGQLDAAAENFTRVTRMAPAFAEAYFNLALVRVQQGRVDQAIVLLQKSLRLKPGLRGANLFLGIEQYRNEDYDMARAALQREIQLDPRNADALMWLGVVDLARGDPGQAAASLDKAAKIEPDNVDILYHRGRAHMLISKQSYEQMFKADPKSWRVHQVLAQSFTEENRLDEAAGECRQAIQMKPAEPGLHEQLGDIYWQQNLLDKAEAAFQQELEIDSRNSAARYKLAVVSLERSKPEVAAALLKQVLQKSPDSLPAHYQLGRAEAQLGDNQDAVRNFNWVVQQPAKADADTLRESYYQLAQLYRRLQRPDDSRLALASFLRLKQQADAQQKQTLQDKLRRSGPTGVK